MTDSHSPTCVLCQRDESQVPIISFRYLGAAYHICSQHLPMLIHDPAQLIGKLPGAETLRPSELED